MAASAATAAPALRVMSWIPDYVTPGEGAQLYVSVLNVGDAPMTGNLTLRYTFPADVAVVDPEQQTPSLQCQSTGQVDQCVVDVTGVPVGGQVRFKTVTTVDLSASGSLVGSVQVSGGGAPDVETEPISMIAGPIGPFGIKTFALKMADGPGAAMAQAGGDPAELTTDIAFDSQARTIFNFPDPSFVTTAAPESFKDVVVHVPAGLLGLPASMPLQCQPSQLTTPVVGTAIPQCPPESQVGLVQLNGNDIVPLYNIEHPPGSPAEFGFFYQSIVVTLLAKVRSSDYGVDLITRDAPSSIPIPKFEVTLWGVPGDPSHNPLRGVCLQGGMGNNGGDCSLSTPRVRFLRLPTSCSRNLLAWGIDVDTYQHPDTSVHADATTPALTGCELNPFEPTLQLTPTAAAPGAATGLDATVSLPQSSDPDRPAEADVRSATVTLPPGMTINPSSADGLQACADAAIPFGRDGVASCPDASKIGTVTLRTPLLDHPLDGSIFLRTQNSDDPMSGQLFRLAVEIRSDDDGVDIKLPAQIRADPLSGQLTTTFDDLPQLPFSSMQLHFKDGPRAPLVAPRLCGTNAAATQFVSWGGRLVTPPSSFELTGDGAGGCSTGRFSPSLRAGVEHAVAGKSSPFHMALTRGDDDQLFRVVTVYTPTGLLGRIESAQQCSDAAAAADACPAGSQVGRATIGAGAGNPFYITNGRVYLTGPYKGAPYGLAIAVHALAGPFDLGTVIVRAAIRIDPRTAGLRVVSDPFPTAIKGVPPTLRDIRIAIDKPGFMVNPTRCTPKHVAATVTSVEGANVGASSRFQVGGCDRLRFSPRMSMSVGAAGHTGVRQSAPLSTTIVQPAGQANLKRVKVTLPAALDALLPVVARACTLAEYQAGGCERARAGSATAVTPLLSRPLSGGAYFVKHPGRGLPDLMVALRGDVSLDLVGRISIRHNTQLVTDFDTIPDAPVTRFTLNIVAGKNGPIGVVTNLCSKKARNATVAISITGQNGAQIDKRQRLRIRGCPAVKQRTRR